MSRLTLTLGIALLLVEAVGAYAILETSDRASNGTAWNALAILAGAAFVVAGLMAIARRPDNRTGVYLAAVGYLWFVGALSQANNAWIFSLGFVVGGFAFVPFAALLLSHPTGRFDTRFDARFPWLVGITLVTLDLAVVLVDRSPVPSCPDCPTNKLLLFDSPGLANALSTLTTVAGVVLASIGVGLMVRRWRRAAPALRRTLWPVLVTGGAALAALIVDGILSVAASTETANAVGPVFFVSFAAVPFAFLFGILRTRLARSSVTDIVRALQNGVPIQLALSSALGDPSLQVVYWLEDLGIWVDADAMRMPEPGSHDGRSVTMVERDGTRVAAIVHDPALDEDPELVETVAAAAGLSFENEHLAAGLRAHYLVLETITDTAPSLLVNVGTDGRILNQNRAAVKAAGLDNQEQVRGRFFWDVFIAPEEREDVIARFHALAPDYAASEYENTFTNEHGERRVVYWRAAPVQHDDGRVVSIIAGGLDITERHRQEEELRASRARLLLAEEDARRKLERNLHDGAQQRLVSISVALRLAESKLGEHPEEAAELVRGTREELSLALDELRELARGIHPAVLTDRGLRAALEALAGRAPIPVELDTVDERVAPAVEAAAYYVVAEALTNVAKYARASSATVCVARRDGALTVSVTDDGVGGADPGRGSGLRGLADRLAALDGSLAVESQNGAGTRVRAEIPLGSQPSVS